MGWQVVTMSARDWATFLHTHTNTHTDSVLHHSYDCYKHIYVTIDVHIESTDQEKVCEPLVTTIVWLNE